MNDLYFTAEEIAAMKARAPGQESIIDSYVAKRPINTDGFLDYRFKRATDKYPDQILIYRVVGQESTRWAAKRNSMPRITTRRMDIEECKDAHCMFREGAMIYKDWDGLIEDERELGYGNEQFFKELEAGAKKYPCVDKARKPKVKPEPPKKEPKPKKEKPPPPVIQTSLF